MGSETVILTYREKDILKVVFDRYRAPLPRECIHNDFYDLQQMMLDEHKWKEPVFHFKQRSPPGTIPYMHSTLLDIVLNAIIGKGCLWEDERGYIANYCTYTQAQRKIA